MFDVLVSNGRRTRRILVSEDRDQVDQRGAITRLTRLVGVVKAR